MQEATAVCVWGLHRLRTGMAGRWRKNVKEGMSGQEADELLQMSSLQRLARDKISEMEVRMNLPARVHSLLLSLGCCGCGSARSWERG